MKLKIYLDLDGVIYNWMESALEIFNINKNDTENKRILKTYHDGLEMIVPKQELFEKIESLGEKYWENLKLLPWANSLYEGLCEIGEVTILTSPGFWSKAGEGKLAALKRDFHINKFILAKDKHLCAAPNCILIDDKKKNVANFREFGGWAFLWPNQFCIEDNEPNKEIAIDQCLKYTKEVRRKILDRRVNQIMNELSHDNLKEEDLTER